MERNYSSFAKIRNVRTFGTSTQNTQKSPDPPPPSKKKFRSIQLPSKTFGIFGRMGGTWWL